MSAPRIGQDWQRVLRSMDRDWDSYGGATITSEAIATVESFVVVPRSNGGVQVEINQDGFNIEIVIDPSGEIIDAEMQT